MPCSPSLFGHRIVSYACAVRRLSMRHSCGAWMAVDAWCHYVQTGHGGRARAVDVVMWDFWIVGVHKTGGFKFSLLFVLSSPSLTFSHFTSSSSVCGVAVACRWSWHVHIRDTWLVRTKRTLAAQPGLRSIPLSCRPNIGVVIRSLGGI
ncbi:hypothetical protein BDN67DRAFT_183239 [Paxillus ammoniavirescens]|nr:hypothetical protein BDN67DRAFT_183239 [Paxillus ammoniavirescens]